MIPMANMAARYTLADTELAGQLISAGDAVILAWPPPTPTRAYIPTTPGWRPVAEPTWHSALVRTLARPWTPAG